MSPLGDETPAIAKVAEFGTRLLDTVTPFFTPFHAVRQAKADVRAEIIRAEGRLEVAKLEDRGIEERALERVRMLERWRQRNLEEIYEEAKALPAPSNFSAEPVGDDWVASFIGHCQDVSDEQMRSVWARMLQGEVAQPGIFSLRTLAAVKLLTVNDARLFTRLCSYVWQVPNGPVPILPHVLASEDGGAPAIGEADLLNLEGLGLVHYDGLSLRAWNTDAGQIEVSYFGRRHAVSSAKNGIQLESFVFFTGVGAELAPIAGAEPNEEYRAHTVVHWRATGLEVTELSA